MSELVPHGDREPFISGAQFVVTFMQRATANLKKELEARPVSSPEKTIALAYLSDIVEFVEIALNAAKEHAKETYLDVEVELAKKPFQGSVG